MPDERRVTAGTGAAVHSLWLSSSEHYFWNRPRRVELVRLLDAPATPNRYAVLHVGEDQPDGPMRLVAAGRFDPPWTEPPPGATVHLSVWRLDDDAEIAASVDGVYEPPRRNPDAWCDLVATEDEARDVYRRYPDR